MTTIAGLVAYRDFGKSLKIVSLSIASEPYDLIDLDLEKDDLEKARAAIAQHQFLQPY